MDFIDGKEQVLFWRGGAWRKGARLGSRGELVDEAVRAILDQYPPNPRDFPRE